MKEVSKEKQVDDTMLDLLSGYHMLKSTVEIFSEAVDYDTNLDCRYNDMIKLVNMLVLSLDPIIELLCEQLQELSKNSEN